MHPLITLLFPLDIKCIPLNHCAICHGMNKPQFTYLESLAVFTLGFKNLMSHNYIVSKSWTEPRILTANICYIKYLPIFQHFCNI